MATVLDFTTPHVLRNDAEYNAAVTEIDALLDADVPEGTSDHERLEFLSVLVQAYEGEHHPIETSNISPQDVVEFMLEQKGMTRADLADAMGGRSRVSEFFSSKRAKLSRGQIEGLRDLLGIPADLLL
ncbi:type II toxin-antitoxin system HigA family antitoxin [soil metagenome]